MLIICWINLFFFISHLDIDVLTHTEFLLLWIIIIKCFDWIEESEWVKNLFDANHICKLANWIEKKRIKFWRRDTFIHSLWLFNRNLKQIAFFHFAFCILKKTLNLIYLLLIQYISGPVISISMNEFLLFWNMLWLSAQKKIVTKMMNNKKKLQNENDFRLLVLNWHFFRIWPFTKNESGIKRSNWKWKIFFFSHLPLRYYRFYYRFSPKNETKIDIF